MLTEEELLKVRGGATFNAALLTAFTNIFVKLYKFGQSVGSALRRTKDKNYCKIN